MSQTRRRLRTLPVIALAGAGLLAWPAIRDRPERPGAAGAVQASVLGTTTVLAGNRALGPMPWTFGTHPR